MLPHSLNNMSRRRSVLAAQTTLLLAAVAATLTSPAPANPTGEVSITPAMGGTFDRTTPGSLIVTTPADRSIVHWSSFSIGVGELTRFTQPAASSAVLNRVVGGIPTDISGRLESNGSVYLINPNGILVTPSGVIEVGGSFVGSTLDVSDAEFLAGASMTFSGNSTAAVRNEGTISALGGDVFLISRTVENTMNATISAPNGVVGLAGGSEVLLDPTGEEKITVAVTSGNGTVTNAGLISAVQAELKAKQGNIYALAIQNTGTIEATGVVGRNGRVFLKASGGTTNNSGSIRAVNADGTGGVAVHGQ